VREGGGRWTAPTGEAAGAVEEAFAVCAVASSVCAGAAAGSALRSVVVRAADGALGVGAASIAAAEAALPG
jgi:hypothetical protein